MEEIENPVDSNEILVKETVEENREDTNTLQESKEELESEIKEELESEINQKFETDKGEIEVMEVKETVDNREDINMLQESKEELESVITQKFESEKKELEGKVMEVKAEMKKQNSDEIESFKIKYDGVLQEKSELQDEIKKLKMKIKELEKQNFDEIESLKLKYNGVLQEKSELQYDNNKLKKSVDLLNGDLVRERELVSEMGTIQKKLDDQVEESRDLRVKIKKLEKNEVLIQKKLSELEMENEKLVKGKKNLESVKTEKKEVEKRLAESLKAFDDLKQDKERIVLQKVNIEKNRVYQLAKIDDLEKYVNELTATIASLEKNNKMLGSKVDDLEKGYSDTLEKQQLLKLELASLEKNDKMLRAKVAEENKERNVAFQGLLAEKDFIEHKLVDSEKMVEELTREKEGIVAEKNKIEKTRADQSVKAALENVKWRKGYTEALEKQQMLEVELDSERKKMKEIVEEKDVIEKCYNDQMDANKHMKLEVGFLNDDLRRVAAEKSEIQKELELKKKEELGLSLKLKEFQKSRDDTMKEIQEKSLLEQKLVEVEKGNQCLTSKLNAAQMNAEKALLMLKDAAEVMCRDEDEEKEATVESDLDMMKIEEDIQPFASELESIKKALENKDKKMEEMTQQIEKLNKSAKKNSNIWALVSSATTILAAAGATYIARGR
ncbi:hypothetical protein MKW92_031874 [Papaver armeniacum]|nr:hypothetical protein MKW92_031874 [Papaver armeniacum]